MDEQCGLENFRKGTGCMLRVFSIRQVCEKYQANGKDVFLAFMDWKKAYDAIDHECICIHGM